MRGRQEPIAATVIIVHFEAPAWCTETVDAFLASEGVEVAITVVDNGGGPLVVPNHVLVLVPGRNLGYAGGANAVLSEWLSSSSDEFCIVASHDCTPEPEAVAALVAAANTHRRFGMLGPTFTDGDYGGQMVARGDGVQEREWLSGSCLLLRRACLEQIGLFDEMLGSYSEDHDLCLRARDAGWRVGSVAAARASTKGSGLPIAQRRRLGETNAIYLLLKRRRYRSAVGRIGLQVAQAARHGALGVLPREAAATHRRLAAAHLAAIKGGIVKARQERRSSATETWAPSTPDSAA